MDNALQVFNYNSNEVRTVIINDEVWFVGKDIADILGYKDTVNALKDHVDNEDKLTWQIATSGQRRDMTVINESGVYSLIFSSKLPTAKEFKHWVTSEVLPQIHKTGQFSTNKEQPALPAGVIDGAKIILEVAGIKDNQLALALDKLYRSYTGKSALDSCGVVLEAPVKEQLLTPTDIAVQLGFPKPKAGARVINKILQDEGFQIKVAGKFWQPTAKGSNFCVMVDTNKKHSDGTPVRQPKWNSGIVSVIENILQ